jgi:hypothetical protein
VHFPLQIASQEKAASLETCPPPAKQHKKTRHSIQVKELIVSADF